MRILLDECLPRRLAAQMVGHDARTVPQAGWAGIKNGRLLKLAATGFDVFVTVDRNLSYQQNLAHLEIAVIVLCAKSNRFQDLLPMVPQMLTSLKTLRAGEIKVISVT